MKKMKILVIEDDSALRENISILLEESGYEVLCASDGLSGLDLIREHTPNLIICDVMMQGIDGYEVLHRLNEDEDMQKVPFIFLTAKVEKDDLRKGMELGADDYLFKPFSSNDLLKAIQTRLHKKQILITSLVSEGKESRDISDSKKLEIDDKLFLNLKENPFFLKIRDIKYIEASDQYTTVYITNGKKVLLRKSIRYWHELLPEKFFLRIHRSTIINSDQIVRIEKWFNHSFRVYLKDISDPFIISKRYSAEIRKNA